MLLLKILCFQLIISIQDVFDLMLLPNLCKQQCDML